MSGQIKERGTVNKVIEIDPPEKVAEETSEEDLSSKQSANTLFNFTKKFGWLTEILKRKAFTPRYNDENIEVYGLGDETTICFPMTCFCDIHLKRLNPHMIKYGGFGIGLEKSWGINSGVQPIQYININSSYHKEFAEIFTKSLRNMSENEDILADHQNFLLTNLLYLKPLKGIMRTSNEDDDLAKRNFHDEREWRYIPDLSTQKDLTLLIPADHLSPQARLSYSDAIGRNPRFWLKFEYTDIKHLIVKDEQYRELLIHVITNELNISSFEKMLLASKIIVWKNIVKDW